MVDWPEFDPSRTFCPACTSDITPQAQRAAAFWAAVRSGLDRAPRLAPSDLQDTAGLAAVPPGPYPKRVQLFSRLSAAIYAAHGFTLYSPTAWSEAWDTAELVFKDDASRVECPCCRQVWSMTQLRDFNNYSRECSGEGEDGAH